jgi:putative restriction endonuclease
MDFYNWLIHDKKLSKATASKYTLVIQNRIIEWLPSYEIPNNSIEFEALKRVIFDLDIYKERNRIGNNMYSSALNHYGHYLKQVDLNDSTIFEENKAFTSEAERQIKVRLVQNKFRKSLFDYSAKCFISGLSHHSLLIASHIKPWSKSSNEERINPYNGLLLSPNFDRLFDRGLITLNSHGKIFISKKLNAIDKKLLGIPESSIVHLSEKHRIYLEYHGDHIFQK